MTTAALATQNPDPTMLRFAGHNFEPLPSGALYWRARQTLLVADLHFEKMASFARRGQMLPPYDTGMTLTRLEMDLRRSGARHLIALGDSFHRVDAHSLLTNSDRMRLDAITEAIACTWLTGNHDPAPTSLGGTCLPELEIDGLVLAHEPRRGEKGFICGHLHPAARIALNGRSTRSPCFVHDNRLLMLPAYGSSTGAMNILSPAFHGLFNFAALEVVMLGRDRIYPVSPRHLVGG